jgi:hypothetical protein
MSFANTFENDLAKLIYQATAIANIADNAAASPLTQLFVSLHTADPGEAGSQTTSEATYTGYARVAVNRTSGGWSVASNVITNVAAITFGLCTAGSNSITHCAVGTATSGAGKILNKMPVGPLAGVWAFTAVASTDVLTVPIAGLAVDDRVSVYQIEGTQNDLPTGLTEGQVYFVKTAAGSAITLAATSGGAVIDVTADGNGLLYKHAVLAVSPGITPNFAIGQLQITIN